MPNDLPKWQAVYAYFRKLQRDGNLIRINDALRELVRQRVQREAEPSTIVVDSQSVKTEECTRTLVGPRPVHRDSATMSYLT